MQYYQVKYNWENWQSTLSLIFHSFRLIFWILLWLFPQDEVMNSCILCRRVLFCLSAFVTHYSTKTCWSLYLFLLMVLQIPLNMWSFCKRKLRRNARNLGFVACFHKVMAVCFVHTDFGDCWLRFMAFCLDFYSYHIMVAIERAIWNIPLQKELPGKRYYWEVNCCFCNTICSCDSSVVHYVKFVFLSKTEDLISTSVIR